MRRRMMSTLDPLSIFTHFPLPFIPPPSFSAAPFLFKPTVSLVLITHSYVRHRGNPHHSSIHLELMNVIKGD